MTIRFRTFEPSELGVEYWQHTAEGRLPLRECEQCGTKRIYLTAVCWNCHSTAWRWVFASGKATVYGASLVRHRLTDEFPETYVNALVDLAEGVRMMTVIVDAALADVPIGTPVHLAFETLPDGKRLPVFHP